LPRRCGPLPHITGTNPTVGPVTGGTAVTFSGTNFQNGATVSFGGVPATDVRVVDGQTITAIAPPHAAGVADVEIITGGIRFALSGAYAYTAQPASPSPAPAPPPGTTPAPPTPVPAARPFIVANAGGDGVNLRDAPSMTTGKVLITVPEGTDVLVTGPTVDGDGGTWYPVQIGDTSGFMLSEYLNPTGG